MFSCERGLGCAQVINKQVQSTSFSVLGRWYDKLESSAEKEQMLPLPEYISINHSIFYKGNHQRNEEFAIDP